MKRRSKTVLSDPTEELKSIGGNVSKPSTKVKSGFCWCLRARKVLVRHASLSKRKFGHREAIFIMCPRAITTITRDQRGEFNLEIKSGWWTALCVRVGRVA